MKRLLLSLIVFFVLGLSAFAQTPNYGSGFTSPPPGLTLNGGAAINGTHLRLTDGGTSEGRSAFFNTPVNVQSFTNDFTFQLTNANADGFTFTIQGNGPTALGVGGGALGYGPNGGGTIQGIGNSVAVGFQLYSSTSNSEVSLTGDWTNGAAPYRAPGSDTSASGINLHSGDVMSVHMTYDGTILTWTVTDSTVGKSFTKSVNINIASFTGNTAFVGFTGGSGGLTAIQDILTWTYTPNSTSPVPPSITTQPANQTIISGQTATFSVAASGTTPLSYQWQKNQSTGTTIISGATSSSYTTPPTTSSDNGSTFQVIVSNSAGKATSNAATLTVNSSAPGINFGGGFTSTTGLTLNGFGGATPTSGSHLRLTDGGSGEARSAFFNTPVNVQSFTNDFTFQLTNANADGFTFTIQGNGPTALGVGGGALGYGPNGGGTIQGIGNSVAVGFQLYSSTSNSEVSLTGDWTNGAAPYRAPGSDTSASGINLHSGDVMSVHMTYDGTTLTWTVTDSTVGKSFTKSVNINIPSLTLGNSAYVGFTGGSGGLTAVQDILSWTFTSPMNTQEVAMPTFSPAAGTYPSAQTVTISDATTGATIFYTTDGSTPSASSTQYSGPITVSNTTKIEAVASASGMTNSPVASATYTIQSSGGSVATPTFNPVAGTYGSAQIVTISDVTSGATIFYTTDGSTPSTSSTQYTGPITVNSTTTIEAIATASGMTNSQVATATYTIQSSGGGGAPSFGSGFTSSGLTLNGGAALNGAWLQLTDGGMSEARSAFFDTPVNVQSFATTFTFQLTNASADGFTFTIQNKSTSAVGGGGGSLGYGPTSGTTGGIPNSVALGFQLYTWASGQVNLVGLWTNGQSPAATPGTDMSGSSINLHSGDMFEVRIGYSGTTLTMDIRDMTLNDTHFTKSFTIDIPGTVGSSTAYVGFTGGDGGLTATQDILSWSYSSSATGTSGAFIWPVDPPAFVGVNDYSTYNGQYHTGLDLCPGTIGCQRGAPLYATASGTVQAVQVTTDPSQTMCDGSPVGSLTTENNNHLGNAVIIAHANGKFSVYGHMDCVWPGIAPGVSVSQGQRIGNIGNSQYGVRQNSFVPHVHFEIKDAGIVGDPATGTFSGFTPDLPDGYGYHDPRVYLFPFSHNSMSNTAVKAVGSPSLSVLTGPDTSYSFLTTVSTGQEFVAFASSGSWYEIYLPNSQGPVSGWIPASAGSVILAAQDSTATQIQVKNTGSSGLLIRPSASSSTNLISWITNTGFSSSAVQSCASSAKIWDGQSFVTSANQNGWYQFYLPANYFFSSASTCQAPSGFGPSFGWSSGSFLNVIP